MKKLMRKRLLSVTLAAVMLFASASYAVSANYTDVTDENMKKAVDMLNSLGVVASAEKFNPSGALTRAMFCAMAVPLTGISDISQYKTYTLFPDVRSNHWGMGYVNAAVKLKLISPRPDGTFAPDQPITYNEAVTILVRLLGYGEEDVGYSWPKNFLTKANAIGLTNGVAVTETLNRGQGALLAYNLLYTPVKEPSKTEPGADSGMIGDYIEVVFGVKQISDAVISEVNVYTGGKQGIRTADGDFYPTRKETDKALIDCRAEILLDNKNYVLNIEPHKQTFDTITLQNAYQGHIVDSFNREIDISASTQVLHYGEIKTYSAIWESMARKDMLKVAYTPSGDIDYLVWMQSDVIYVNNVIIVGVNAVDDDGNFGIMVDDETEFYPTKVNVDDEMLGRRVDMVVNNRGQVIKVEPLSQSMTTLTADIVRSVGIVSYGGANTLISENTTVYGDGVKGNYSAVYGSISSGDTLRVFYKKNGAIDYIMWIKNNANVGGTIYLSVFYPAGSNDTTLSIGGNTFTLTPEATLQAARFRTGERVILVISSSGVISAVYAGSNGGASGMMTSSSTATLQNGLSLSVTPDFKIATGTSVYGMRVRVYGDENGNMVAD